MERFSVSMKNLSAIVIDGAPVMVAKNSRLVKKVNNEAITTGNTILICLNY